MQVPLMALKPLSIFKLKVSVTLQLVQPSIPGETHEAHDKSQALQNIFSSTRVC